jgi:hypothetical protein
MKLLILLSALFLFGCQQQAIVNEYIIDDIHYVIGVMERQGNETTIASHDGQIWTVPKGVKIEIRPLTLESFQRVTK